MADETTTRAQLAAALRAALPGSYTVYGYPLNLGPLSAAVTAAIVVERRKVEPAPNQGSARETFWIWVITDQLDEEKAEDTLDTALTTVLDALLPLTWCTAPDATRDRYDEQKHAYRIEITVNTNKE
ncbi:hypothetical protein EV379_0908 [Microterricola gilva]|uniref:DUF3168 domain-containing protein n=1 Tax=Microterricola gilva TaxID=393267 RepID=A0A4Q8AL42_9MICO|nr:hypothetical protein [Microterricola gilva]RZU64605.1 hypothetical protein EV379_0908 [Microterricola gilva]